MIAGLPIWLIFTAAAAPIIAAFFYRRRSRVIDIPAIAIWRQVGRPVEFRSISTLLRSLMSLAAQLLIIGLIVIAIATTLRTEKSKKRLVIIIDQGVTMQTREPGNSSQTRFELAHQSAVRLLQTASPDAKVLLIAAAHRPMVQSNAQVGASDAIAQLARIQPLDVETDLPSAINAASFVRNDPTAAVFVFSDFAVTEPTVLRGIWRDGAASLHIIPIGSDQPDATITNLWCESRRSASRIGATLNSRGMNGRTVNVSLISEHRVLKVIAVTLTGEPQMIELDADLTGGSPYEIALKTDDALSIDDHAFGILPLARRGICLITSGNHALVNALRAESMAAVRIVRPKDFDGPHKDAVIIVDGPGFSGPMAKDVGWLFIGTGDPAGLIALDGQSIDSPRVTHWAGEHPILADVEPDLWSIRRAFRINQSSLGPYRSLVSAQQMPLIIESDPLPIGPKRVYWLFDLSETNLSTRIGFPVLLWNTIDYLSNDTDATTPIAQTGRPMTLDAQGTLSLVDPAQQLVPLSRTGEKATASDVTKQGFYTVITPKERKQIPVNLFSASALSTLHREEVIAESADPPAARIEPDWKRTLRWPLTWQAWLIAALTMACVEWVLYHRRLLRVG